MKTLTINIPDSLDPAVVRWELARSLYEKKEITLEEAAKMVDLAPTYFKIRLQKSFDPTTDQIKQEWLSSTKLFDRQRFDELVKQLDIRESWEELVSQIGK